MPQTSTTRRLLAGLALLVLPAGLAVAEEDAKTSVKKPRKHYYNSYVGKRPPELTGLAAHWVNQSDKVTLEKLHGQVVWLEFNF